MDALGFLRHVLDRDRLAVLGLVAAGPRAAGELAGESGLSERDVLAALAPLVQASVVVRDGQRYRLRPGALREFAKHLPAPEPADRLVLAGMTVDEQQIPARFFQGQRLVEIPASRAKRRVVLERIALDFEPGVRYPEADVNKLLAAYHDDWAALRRHLYDEGLLDRAGGLYWRAGGRVP